MVDINWLKLYNTNNNNMNVTNMIWLLLIYLILIKLIITKLIWNNYNNTKLIINN